MRRALVALLVLGPALAGCASPPTGFRSVLLDAPDAAALLPRPADLPGFDRVRWQVETATGLPGFVDAHSGAWRRPEGGSEVGALAWRFDSSEHADAAFERVRADLGPDASAVDAGDEAARARPSTHKGLTDEVLVVRERTVVWILSHVRDDRASLDLEALARTLAERVPEGG